MTEKPFSLRAFPASRIPSIAITGKISLQKNFLSLHYALAGDLESLLLPAPSTKPSRRDDLWKSTCFEFFLAIKDQPQYWEFNLSPSGDWNVYHMDAYRRVGFTEELLIQELPFVMEIKPRSVSLDLCVDLSSIVSPDQSLELGMTAIMQTTDGEETYWALTHPGSAPDFHLRESFVVALIEQVDLSRQSTLNNESSFG